MSWNIEHELGNKSYGVDHIRNIFAITMHFLFVTRISYFLVNVFVYYRKKFNKKEILA